MKSEYWMFRRKNGVFYYEDTQTSKQESLNTRDRRVATRLLHAKTEAQQQPRLNLQIARAYLMASDPAISKRTWQHVMDHIITMKTGSTQIRWFQAAKDRPFNLIRHLPVL